MSTVDFFEGQVRARRRTGLLVLFFLLAVILIVAAVYFVIAFALYTNEVRSQVFAPSFLDWIGAHPGLLVVVLAGTLLTIGAGTAFKLVSLTSGGQKVATALGGERVLPNTKVLEERRLLNVVEEVAIASGTPVPPVYLLRKERGINAFAAGHTVDDAVIGVTRGTVSLLDRDELQGVIAHEFSHILSGDMRINLRLVGVLHGILLIGIIGYIAFRGGLTIARGMGRGSSGSKGAGGILAAFLGLVGVGVAVMLIGYVGTFFGRLIKAAVSRQREFLADSSAVQFTRNPHGISGALKKIGGTVGGAKLRSPRVEEASHMLFGQGFSSFMGPIFATHPPLPERILRIDPTFDGKFPRVSMPEAEARTPLDRAARAMAKRAREKPAPATTIPLPLIDLIGRPDPAHLVFAAALTASLPDPLKEAAREPYGSRAVIYALLLNRDAESRRVQLERLAEKADPAVTGETHRLAHLVDRLDREKRLPLVDIAIGGLRELSPPQYAAFSENVDHLIRADSRIDLFEWILGKILSRHLEPHFAPRRKKAAEYYSLKPFSKSCGVLLSALAYTGTRDEAAAEAAFRRGAAHLEKTVARFQPRAACTLTDLDEALEKLNSVSPRHKRMVLAAGATTIAADREITAEEAELFRAMADALGIPVPPVLPGQPLIGASST